MTETQTSPTQTDFPITIAGVPYLLAFPMAAYWAYNDATGIDLLAADPRVLKPGLTNEGLAAIVEEMQAEYLKKPFRQRQKDSCDLLWAGLQLHHPDLTREAVEKLVSHLSAHEYRLVEMAALQAHRASLEGPKPAGHKEGAEPDGPLAEAPSAPN
jgi:hypothetical protein